MLRHQIPNGDLAELLDRPVTVLLAELTHQKFAATEHPRPARPTAQGSRHIPAEVKRAVWLRDLGRCTFVGPNGRCEATGMLEFHHVMPYAAGGEATISNIVLHCRGHNCYAAGLAFGPFQTREGFPADSARAGLESGRPP